MVPPHKVSYRSDLFDISALTSIDAIENAVDEFRAIVNETNGERMLDNVIAHEPPAVVRLVLSSLNEELIMSCFPATPEGFGASVACKILSYLSVLFLFAQSVPALHEKHHALVKEAPELLTALTSKLFVDGAEPDPATPSVKKGKATSQKKVKIARRLAAQPKNALDPTPFEHLNIPIPETPEEVEKCIEIVLATQRSILEAYLESLRLPAVAASVKATFLSAETTSIPESEEPLEPEEVEVGPTYQSNDSPEVSYPALQPIKFSTLYRRRATGFGEWEVNIAPRAERDMREYNQRDRKTFSVIVKKMRDLSNGDFSPANYKQINGGNVEVPIYEAKVTEELRLVYQIDCAPIYDKKSEQQTLKVFGIYQNAQLTRGTFWDSMSRELGKKGQEYKYRCALRQQSVGAEGYIFVPATFPAHEARLSPGSVPDLPSDDAEQIQSLLLKTVHFSQELLDNILADRDIAFVFQISPRELDIIEHPHSCYVLGRSGTGKSTTILYKMLMVEASSELSPPTARKIRQLFVSQSPILAEKVGEHFAKLLGGYRPITVSENLKAAKWADRALVDEEENDWRSDLPKKYSDLQDTDFPLFVSFEQLCSMIEYDMLASDVVPTRKTILTYDKFRKEYWPHLQQSLPKDLIIPGVIMGSEETLTSKSHCLDRNAYLNLGERRQSTFAGQRRRIYDLFEKYMNQKRRQGDTDVADRTHSILKFFQDHGVPGRKIDYLYVDETQDNLLIDTLLLRSLCQNPNGLFWAGDTAQAISVGSSFRFNELKAFLFRIEGQRQKKHPEFNFHPAVPPRVFQLTVNYRSHAGIVNCARSVIDVITKLWPDAIDVLDGERGTVDGLRPIFFTNWESENVQFKQFLFGDRPSGGPIELGAQQCILVRNDAARKKLQNLVGDIGLIMTLYESKGLEFNDVLLYNFFEDSGVAEAQWRVVLNVMDNGPPAPTLDNMRHASVCAELKFLYVAITRARNNIWIADCSTKGEPMRMLWTSKDQVQNCVSGTYTPRFAISSTPAEWREQGRKLFDNKRFSQARLCYTRAYMPHQAAVAQAYHLREEASEMPCNFRRQIVARKAAFLGVAAAFMDCAKNDPGDAALVYFRRAGECFENAEDVVQAITAYTCARYFGRVAELYQHLGKFDEAVATVQTHSQDIDPDIAERVIGVARLFYFNKGQMEKARKLFVRQEEALEEHLRPALQRASLWRGPARRRRRPLPPHASKTLGSSGHLCFGYGSFRVTSLSLLYHLLSPSSLLYFTLFIKLRVSEAFLNSAFNLSFRPLRS
ncbi:P-loop containing nucleoside triphosphate hydrolase protein, partial [Mycena olivaceomarginata]